MRPMNDNWGVIIPARYESSRFPGKPLVEISGISLIQRVWLQCKTVIDRSKIYIATDDFRIADHVTGFGGQIVMTSGDCLTGTDRVYEAASKLNLSNVINVQGDEPLLSGRDLNLFVEKMKQAPDKIFNGMAKISSEEEYNSQTVIKVVTKKNGQLMYMSRSPIPTNKTLNFEVAYKQVCIYAYPIHLLSEFVKNGKKTPLEQIEDIEILRFLENNIDVEMIEVSKNSLAVDVPSDVQKVELAIKKQQC